MRRWRKCSKARWVLVFWAIFSVFNIIMLLTRVDPDLAACTRQDHVARTASTESYGKRLATFRRRRCRGKCKSQRPCLETARTRSLLLNANHNLPRCQLDKIGKTVGSGTYAIVKEVIHVETRKYFTCKVINKKDMEGREDMVFHPFISSSQSILHLSMRSAMRSQSSSVYQVVIIVMLLPFTITSRYADPGQSGVELFDRICTKGKYCEPDAASLVKTILKAVKYIHDYGIVHRNLKPEKLLFRTPQEDADIMITDFGLSRIVEEENIVTEMCGTPGYISPEVYKQSEHGKPVDIWAMGVITYFLLAGYTPFDRDTQQQEKEATIAGDYKFEPEEYWKDVSPTAKDFVRTCLTVNPAERPTAAVALQHEWLANEQPHLVPDPAGDSEFYL